MNSSPDRSARPKLDPGRLDTTNEPAVFEPQDWISYCADRAARDIPRLPRLGVQVLLREGFTTALKRLGATPDDFSMAGHPFAVVNAHPAPFVVAWSAKGSASAGGIEELIALGVDKLVVVGGAGAMTEELEVGDVVVASAALRDDGVSGHYEPLGTYSYPSDGLTRQLEIETSTAGLEVVSAPVWSMTAYFRQTPTRLETFRGDGCVAVCNEAAAAFSIGRYREVDVAAMFVIGDSIARGRFDVPREPDAGVAQTMIDAAVHALIASSRP